MTTSKVNSDFWVQGVRQQLKLTSGVGSSYRISQQSGRCKLDVQYSDKSRKVATLPIDWKQEKFKQGFTFQNPNETERCGCGESFKV